MVCGKSLTLERTPLVVTLINVFELVAVENSESFDTSPVTGSVDLRLQTVINHAG